jgi:hypothetical protein
VLRPNVGDRHCQAIWCHYPEDHIMNLDHCENPGFRMDKTLDHA